MFSSLIFRHFPPRRRICLKRGEALLEQGSQASERVPHQHTAAPATRTHDADVYAVDSTDSVGVWEVRLDYGEQSAPLHVICTVIAVAGVLSGGGWRVRR